MDALIAIVLVGVVVVAAIGVLVMLWGIKKDLKGKAAWSAPTQVQIERTQMMGDDLREMSEMMREQVSRERDAELAAYAERKRKHQPILNPLPGPEREDKIKTKNTKANILIPEHLTEEEKQVLRDFYDL